MINNITNRKISKYENFKYNKEIVELISSVKLNESDIERIKKITWNDTHKYIIKDLYILAEKCKLSTSQLSIIYDVSIRSIQNWLKKLGINRNLIQAREIGNSNYINKIYQRNKQYIGKRFGKWVVKDIDYKKSKQCGRDYFVCECQCLYKTVNSVTKRSLLEKTSTSCGCKPKINHIYNNDLKSKIYHSKFCLYRLLDKNKNILYIGKCSKSCISNGHGGQKEYFIKDRLIQHFTPSSKQIPKSLYLNTKYIEISFPAVESNEELESLESSLVKFYERYKLWCPYNKDLKYVATALEDTQKWEQLYELTENDIEILKHRYGYEDIPSIEIINQRLDSMLFIMDKYNISH